MIRSKVVFLASFLLCNSICLCGQITPTLEVFDKLDGAARVFAVSQGMATQYRLGLLRGKTNAGLGGILELFENEYPKLIREERFKLAILILVNYEFTGTDNSERFGDMIFNDIAAIRSALKGFNRERLRAFVSQNHADWEGFRQRCSHYCHVDL